MNFKENLPQTADEYILCFRKLAAITSEAMDYVEANKPIHLASLDRIAQNVETLSCLRGDSGIYRSSRPQGLSNLYQTEMYETEYSLKERLKSIGYNFPPQRSLGEVIESK